MFDFQDLLHYIFYHENSSHSTRYHDGCNKERQLSYWTSVWCSKYYFFHNFLQNSLQKSFQLIFFYNLVNEMINPATLRIILKIVRIFDHSTFLLFEIYRSLLYGAVQDKVQKAQIISLSCSKHVSQQISSKPQHNGRTKFSCRYHLGPYSSIFFLLSPYLLSILSTV